MSIKKIFVPTDFSKEADEALEVAVEIAERANAEVILFHVVSVPSGIQMPTLVDSSDSDGVSSDPDTLYSLKLMNVIKLDMAKRKKKYPKVTISDQIVVNEETIDANKYAEENKADLIVMGTKGGDSTDGDWEFVSNTQAVVRNATCPVLAIKGKINPLTAFKSLLYASDFEHVSESGVETVKYLQGLFTSTVHLVTVMTRSTFEPMNDTTKKIKKFASNNQLDNYTTNVFTHHTEGEGIVSFANEVGGSIVCMNTHGRKGFKRWLMGSLTESMVNYSDIAILSFNMGDVEE